MLIQLAKQLSVTLFLRILSTKLLRSCRSLQIQTIETPFLSMRLQGRIRTRVNPFISDLGEIFAKKRQITRRITVPTLSRRVPCENASAGTLYFLGVSNSIERKATRGRGRDLSAAGIYLQ